MASEFMMPKLGLTMTEGTVSKWYKAVGDAVIGGEILVEVETDKITNQLEAPEDGVVLDILVPEGKVAACQAPIAILGKPGETVMPRAVTTSVSPTDAGVTVSAPSSLAVVSRVAVTSTDDGGRLRVSPIARRLATEQGIDLNLVTGTGPHGRIVERDVLSFAARAPAKATSPTAAASPTTSGVPLSGMRKVIAERMSQSWHTAPHVNMTFEVDMTAASELKTALSAATGTKYSFTEIIVRCCAQALVEFKAVNASLVNGQIYRHEAVNIGVAVALDDGLIVPVIRNAAQKSINALHDDIQVLGAKARQGQLGPDDVSGGTFTVSNLGMFGVDEFTPIINQPESAILGVCRVVDRPVSVGGAVKIKPMMNLCLSCDHRLIDGAVAARFMARIRQLLEQPLLLI
jgi:pyruvate dehydrogenase E2 component (dihydrolipoamide acetyltransferase)